MSLEHVSEQIVDELQSIYRPQGLGKLRKLKGDRLLCLRLSVNSLIADSLPLIMGRTSSHRYASIHKRSNYYSGDRYDPSQTYKIHVVTAYEGMVWLGYLKEEKIGVSVRTQGKYLTRYSATRKLLMLFGDVDIELLPVLIPSKRLEEPLIVKIKREEIDERGERFKISERLDYADTPTTQQMRSNLDLINNNLERHWIDIDLKDSELHEVRRQLAQDTARHDEYPETLNLGKRCLHRSFLNTEFTSGGRFYGGWWQIIPKLFRSHILIDDKKTVELDYSGLHPAFLYAQEGHQVPDDPYDVGLSSDHRDIVKRAFNAMLNAEKKLERAPQKLNIRQTEITWKELSNRLSELHRPIQHHFYTGIGNYLQFRDSQIAERIMLRFITEKSGAVVLPVHDSFIVHHGYETELHEMMIEEFQRACGQQIHLGKLAQRYVSLTDRPENGWRSLDLDELLRLSDVGCIKRFEKFAQMKARK
ncbi:MAG: hypothetical protein VW270_20555 [Candidatus Poseidoniales archaeon]|jgi:hypothetical protein